jgi:hypothetical protein
MPIRPEHMFLYPIDWPQLSHHVRFVRAGALASIVGALMGRGYSIYAMGDGGTGNGIAGATGTAGACGDQQRTS